MMKAEILNPIVASVVNIFKKSVGVIAVPGLAYVHSKSAYTTGNVTAIIGITGQVTGQIILSMSVQCANEILSRMMKTTKHPITDIQGKSALSELINIISGNALHMLSQAGYVCDITPPSLMTGRTIEIASRRGVKNIVVPIDFHFGKMELNITLSETDKATA